MGVGKPLIVGNWKMFGRRADLAEIEALAAAAAAHPAIEVVVCPPVTLLEEAGRRLAGSLVRLGAQDAAPGGDGAHTGDVNAAMLAECGARYVILGHSERRRDHGESDALVRAKAQSAIAAGLVPIVCVGESLKEREAGRASAVVVRQIGESAPDAGAEYVVAYEPIWAIGAGVTPSVAEIEAIHAALRAALSTRGGAGVRLLYGGSVKPENAAALFAAAGVDGALVGAASLKAASFAAILAAHSAARA